MLRRYLPDSSHVISATSVDLLEDLSFEEREATGELESVMMERFPDLFSMDTS